MEYKFSRMVIYNLYRKIVDTPTIAMFFSMYVRTCFGLPCYILPGQDSKFVCYFWKYLWKILYYHMLVVELDYLPVENLTPSMLFTLIIRKISSVTSISTSFNTTTIELCIYMELSTLGFLILSTSCSIWVSNCSTHSFYCSWSKQGKKPNFLSIIFDKIHAKIWDILDQYHQLPYQFKVGD